MIGSVESKQSDQTFSASEAPASRIEVLHPFVVRLTHWLNFVALLLMVTSGWRIYNASPIWGFSFPGWMTTGGWLAGARHWHFFGMWIFFINGVIWVLYNILSRHGRETTLFRPTDIGGLLPMIRYYLRLDKRHPKYRKYNALQKLTYTGLITIGLGMILTGVAIYWPVQFSWVTALFGDYDLARVWHFLFMASLTLFFFGHLVLVGIAGWPVFVSMLTGRQRVDADAVR